MNYTTKQQVLHVHVLIKLHLFIIIIIIRLIIIVVIIIIGNETHVLSEDTLSRSLVLLLSLLDGFAPAVVLQAHPQLHKQTKARLDMRAGICAQPRASQAGRPSLISKYTRFLGRRETSSRHFRDFDKLSGKNPWNLTFLFIPLKEETFQPCNRGVYKALDSLLKREEVFAFPYPAILLV